MKLVDDRLFVNGNINDQYFPSSPPQEVAIDAGGITVKVSDRIQERNNTFSGFSASVTSLREVRRVVDKVLQSPSVARCSHLTYALIISKE